MKAAKKALERLYTGVCTITERQEVKDPFTHITSTQAVTVTQDQPCRLSFERLLATTETDTVTAISQKTKLFLAPEVPVREGSQVSVTQAGETRAYRCSGPPAVYVTHQEVMLELEERWA